MEEQQRVVTETQHVQTAPVNDSKKRAVYTTYNSVWFIVGIIETLLAFRFVFELFAANPASPFTQFIYSLSYPFAAPFQSIFGVTTAGVAFLDWSLFVAALVYLLVGYGIIQLLRIIKPLNQEDLNAKVNEV